MKTLLLPSVTLDHDKKNQDTNRSLIRLKLEDLLRRVAKLEGH